MKPQRYEVQVRGCVSPDVFASWVQDIHLQSVTLISVQVRDQAQLHDVLRRLQGLGIDVVSINTSEVAVGES